MWPRRNGFFHPPGLNIVKLRSYGSTMSAWKLQSRGPGDVLYEMYEAVSTFFDA